MSCGVSVDRNLFAGSNHESILSETCCDFFALFACLNLFDTFSKENTGEQQAACAAENVKMQKGASFLLAGFPLTALFLAVIQRVIHQVLPGHAVRSTYCARKRRLAAKPSHLST